MLDLGIWRQTDEKWSPVWLSLPFCCSSGMCLFAAHPSKRTDARGKIAAGNGTREGNGKSRQLKAEIEAFAE